MSMTNTRSVLVLGSTGSVGTQALDLIAAHPDRFTVAGLAAGGGNLTMLGRQIREHGVRRVAVAGRDAATTLRRSLPGMGLRGVEVWSGPAAAAELTTAAGGSVTATRRTACSRICRPSSARSRPPAASPATVNRSGW